MTEWITGEAPIRHCLILQLDLAARVGAQLPVVSDQYVKLRAGQPVVVTREQLSSFGHSLMPANLPAHAQWILTNDNTLSPAS
jgi:hypothetical protein